MKKFLILLAVITQVASAVECNDIVTNFAKTKYSAQDMVSCTTDGKVNTLKQGNYFELFRICKKDDFAGTITDVEVANCNSAVKVCNQRVNQGYCNYVIQRGGTPGVSCTCNVNDVK